MAQDDADATSEPDVVLHPCPSCGEEDQEVVRQAASGWTLRCLDCGRVHQAPAPPKLRLAKVPCVLADGAASQNILLELPSDALIGPGDELTHDGRRVLLTGIDLGDGSHPAKARAAELRRLYAKAFDTVTLGVTLNVGEMTRSLRWEVAPEQPVHIGEVIVVEGLHVAVKTLKSDQNRTLHRGFLLARNVRRIFCDPAPGGRPGTRVATRLRGAGPHGSKGPRSRDKAPRGTGSRRA